MSAPDLVRIDPRLDGSRPDPSDALWPMLSAALKHREVAVPRTPTPTSSYWSADHFQLTNTHLFRDASDEEQQDILRFCTEGLLEEAYFVEKLGLCFNAKMTLLSETTSERMLYSLFAADEAAHLASVSAYLPSGAGQRADQPFLRLLEEVVERGDKPCLTYLVQVVLEGWGMSHYLSIADPCRSEGLRQVLQGILRDEALHHGSGVALSNRHRLPPRDRDFIIEILVRLFQMVQAGPQAVVRSVERVKGSLSREQKVRLFRELACDTHAGHRLELVHSLMRKAHSGTLMPAVEAYGVLRPFSPEECAVVAA